MPSALSFQFLRNRRSVLATGTILGSIWLNRDRGKCEAVPLHANFIADAAEIAAPAVVNIKLSVDASTGPRGPFMYRGGLNGISSGSGFFLRKDGIIVTNAHVIEAAVHPQNNMTLTVRSAQSH